MLQLNDVSKDFGGLKALSNVTLHVRKGQIKGLIGPNGAGKTTLFNLVTGVFSPSRGTIILFDEEITHHKPEKISRLGVSRTFQQPHLFKSLSVWENVMLGRHYRTQAEFFACGLRLPNAVQEEKNIREKSLEYLSVFGLADKKNQIANKLPLGEQRYLEVARALATEPKLLLLDEPTRVLAVEEGNAATRRVQQAKIEKAAEKLEEKKEKTRVIYRTIQKDVDKLVVVYRDRPRLDPDGVSAANAALTRQAKPASQPDKPLPSTNPSMMG